MRAQGQARARRMRRGSALAQGLLAGGALLVACLCSPLLPRAASAQIVGLETAVAGFVGEAQQGPLDQPVLVQSHGDFLTTFGAGTTGLGNAYLAVSVKAFFDNGGQRLWVVRVAGSDGASLLGVPAAGGAPATGLQALAEIDEIGLVAIPGATAPAVHVGLIAHCEILADRICLLDPASRDDVAAVLAERSALGASQGFAALYFPWIEAAPAGVPLELPPSGFVAGVIARSDATRGIGSAPAGPAAGALIGATGLTYAVSSAEQDQLNPNGVNAILAFPSAGILIFGSRTLSTDPEWIYLSVRRLVSWIRESVEEGTAFAAAAVYEPALWAQVESDAAAFLLSLYAQGVFAGSRPEEAFFARCDQTTMSELDRAQGRTILQMGIAPLRPAEFRLLEVVHERAPVAVPGLSGWSAGWLAASGILLGFAVLGARRVMPRG